MIVGLLANRVSLSPKLVKSFIRSIVELAVEDERESTDLQWFRMSLMALINLVHVLPVKFIGIIYSFVTMIKVITFFLHCLLRHC